MKASAHTLTVLNALTAVTLAACGGSGVGVPAYSVAGTYIASSGDGIVNIQFTDATHYTMLRDVCPASDSCSETGSYSLATDGSSITFSPTGEAAYSYPIEAPIGDDTAEALHTLGGVSLTGGGAAALTPGGQDSLTSGTQQSIVADQTVDLQAFTIGGQKLASPSASKINVGFASPTADKMDVLTPDLAAMEAFWAATAETGAHVCHVYLPWNIATNSAAADTEASFATYVPLAQAAGCQEIMVSFKTQSVSACTGGDCSGVIHGNPKTPDDYKAAVKVFVDTWKSKVSLSFSSWNEPNNAADGGSGTGSAGDKNGYVIAPATAAQYYLALREVCGSDCKVAAGDLASVGQCYDAGEKTKDCIDDYQQACPDDVVEPSKLCKEASYLDKYKNALAHYATQYGFKSTFRPEYFAYHGWKEVLAFIDNTNDTKCVAASCSTAAIVESLGGSWRHAAIWNTEVGAGQNDATTDKIQGEAIGHILNWASSISSRIERVDYQGMRGGGWYVVCSDGKHRPGFKVLATRSLSYGGAPSTVCGS